MSNSSLIFFNKDGYPHNFHYNQNTEAWEGKIIFDENSSDTFKTQSLHIFENVEPIDFEFDGDLINIEYFNNSGLTITGEVSYSNETITNITKVNDSVSFYSKWIFGNNFHKKFPIGTIINFSGVTGSTSYISDFSEDQFFTVLSVKKNAVMIITNTDNNTFNFSFISGTTSSLNVINIDDYNRNLSGDEFFQDLYINKKLSIIDSEYNDSVVSIKQSGLSYSYLNDLALNGSEGEVFTLRVNFLTERPKIMQGVITLSDNQYINLGRFANLLEPEITYTGNVSGYTYKEIVFQDYSGGTLFGGSTFEVTSLVDNIFIGKKQLTFKTYTLDNLNIFNNTKWNTIQYDGFLNIKSGDIIKLNGITGNTMFMQDREFNVTNVTFDNSRNKTTIFTPNYIIDETGSTYNIFTKLQPHQITSVRVIPSGDVTSYNNITFNDAYCYSTSTYLDFTIFYNSGISYTIDSFINKYKSTLHYYGVDIYHIIKNDINYLSTESLYGTRSRYFYTTGYNNSSMIANDYSLSDINGLTTKYNIITNEKLYNEKTNRSNSSSLYRNDVSSEIEFYLNYDINNFGFRLTLNGNQYYIKFSGNTKTTIDSFVSTYNDIMYSNGFIVASGHTVSVSGVTGCTLTITSDIDIWDLEVMVNILSFYKITNHQRNKAILLSGSEIKSINSNLFDTRLSTGMIINISGSSFNENNKEYNIINLTNNKIGLSYQGNIITQTGITITGKSREFIRKPRGEYNRDIYLRVYWDTPYDGNIDDSIFLYDITGDQLTPYNNNQQLKYIGPTPLITPQNNVVFLNKTANMDLNRVYNPKYQQTVFDELNFKLEQLDSSLSYNWIPEPLEIYIGYSTTEEGVNNRILKIEKIEKNENTNIIFSFTGYTNSGISMNNNFTFYDNILTYNAPIDFNFISYGFKKDNIITFSFKDQSKTNQKIFENIQTYKILNLTRNKIFVDTGYTSNFSGFTYFNTTGTTFYYKIEIQPKEILSCNLYGQTEIEDIRYKVNLNNLGVQLEDDAYQIIYQSDIEDNAIDYTLYNRKRKEMLGSFREIYDYIGAYKSLINSINFFGYNNLQLFEYYRNIDKKSILYNKLHKVLIPDIFDNTVEGWNEMDFIAGKYQNQNTWKKTNLFNLAYQITDEDGNNILMYSLSDVQYKLTKLKNWLRKNIIPISANLLDITGVADTNQTLYQDYDESNQTKKSVVDRTSTIVNFNYTASLNFGSDYLITVNFYILSGTSLQGSYNVEVPQSFSAKIKTFYLSGDTMIPVQYFKIHKDDLTSFSFNLDKYVDPYIYIETTTYDNTGNGLGFVNNKMFYYDEPRNWWLVTHNFNMSKYKYYQTADYNTNKPYIWQVKDVVRMSTAVNSSVETNVNVNTYDNTYSSTVSSDELAIMKLLNINKNK